MVAFLKWLHFQHLFCCANLIWMSILDLIQSWDLAICVKEFNWISLENFNKDCPILLLQVHGYETSTGVQGIQYLLGKCNYINISKTWFDIEIKKHPLISGIKERKRKTLLNDSDNICIVCENWVSLFIIFPMSCIFLINIKFNIKLPKIKHTCQINIYTKKIYQICFGSFSHACIGKDQRCKTIIDHNKRY